jgi:dTMP kinase
MFITIEGIDGCGKSTQACLLSEYLSKRVGRDKVVWTREPGGWPGSEDLREILLSKEFSHPWTEVFLFIADRCEHVGRIIEPGIGSGCHVICERFSDSTLAYQSWGRGLPLHSVQRALSIVRQPVPQKTVLIDVSPAKALDRLKKRNSLDLYEKQGLEFLQRVSDGYRQLVSMDPSRFIVVNGEGTPENVFAVIRESLEEYL